MQNKQNKLDIKNDIVFKYIFSGEDAISRIAVKSLLSAILNVEIKEIRINNPNLSIQMLKEKSTQFDLLVELDRQRRVVVEMQMRNRSDMQEREEYYLAKLHAKQEIKGDYGYGKVKESIVVVLKNYVSDENDELIECYQLRNEKGKELGKRMKIVEVAIPKVDEIQKDNIENMDKVKCWLFYFKYFQREEKQDIMKVVIEREEGIKMAERKWNEMSESEREGLLEVMEEIAEIDQNYRAYERGEEEGFAKGIEQGDRNGQRKIIEKFLQTMPKTEVCKIMEMSEEEIDQLLS